VWREDPTRAIRTILAMLAVVAVPTLLALSTVRVPQVEMHTVDNPTPYGYTVSLLLFLVPVAAVAAWHWRNGSHFDRKAFWACAGLMTGLGVFLDLFFGYAFFEFPNEGATLGIRVPAWSWGEMRWIPDYLPLEEFGFYVFGALFMMSVYVWAIRTRITGRPGPTPVSSSSAPTRWASGPPWWWRGSRSAAMPTEDFPGTSSSS